MRGGPLQAIHDAPAPTEVAVLGDDYHGMRPRMAVTEGQKVKRGDLLFEDRKTPGVRFTSPGAGEVRAINRGYRRALQSVVILLNEAERSGSVTDADFASFDSYKSGIEKTEDPDAIKALLTESGLWTAFRTRPFSHIPSPESSPKAIFVNAMDTNPLAPRPEVVIEDARDSFELGLRLVSKLTAGPTFLCASADGGLKVGAPVQTEYFAGPHPAGNTGTHINALFVISREKVVWSINYQDVIAVGRLFAEGKLPVERVVALGGAPVPNPRLLRTRLGVSLNDITQEITSEDEIRVISGSVLSGKKAMGAVYGFLGRYDVQVSVLREDRKREFMGWLEPGFNRFSIMPIFVSKLREFLGFDDYEFTTNTYGSERPMVPIGLFEKVVPLDVVPTYLLRSIVVGDLEQAEKLGILELDEEDIALCSYVDPGKTDYAPLLRRNLETIYKEF